MSDDRKRIKWNVVAPTTEEIKSTILIIGVLLVIPTSVFFWLIFRNVERASAIVSEACFSYTTNNNEVTITDYYDNENNDSGQPACPRAVDIPSTIGGVNVTTIGYYAFFNNQLTSLTIPSSVTTIGNSAFSNNQLTSLTIPSSVTNIGSSAFYNNQITTVIIDGNNVSIAGSSIFARNNIITFSYNGTTFSTGNLNTDDCYDFDSGTGEIRRFLKADISTIRDYGQACLNPSVTIPNSIAGTPVTSIGLDAFSYKYLEFVSLPSTITNIGYQAFEHNNLTTISIPNSVTAIGGSAFYYNSITSLIIPGSVTSIGNDAFSNNQIASVSIPNSITTIANGLFAANKLTSVTIPNSVTSIGDHAFVGNLLTSVTIPDLVISIGGDAFSFNQISSVNLGNSLTTIGSQSFALNQITSLIIPNSVTTIGSAAFDANKLTSLNIPSSVTSIGDHAFAFNMITDLTLPSNLTSISEGVFAFNMLSSVNIPVSVNNIDSVAFGGNQIESVTIPDSVTSISPDAFVAQSKPGGASFREAVFLMNENNPDPQAIAQAINAYQQNAIYIQIFANNPGDLGLNDNALTESDLGMGDINNNGSTDDVMSAQIINPTRVQANYKDTNGGQLSPSQVFTGAGLTSYFVKDNPSNNPSLYFHIGQNREIAPIPINGYKTPNSLTLNGLVAGLNPANFVYQALDNTVPSDPTGEDTPTTNTPTTSPNLPDTPVSNPPDNTVMTPDNSDPPPDDSNLLESLPIPQESQPKQNNIPNNNQDIIDGIFSKIPFAIILIILALASLYMYISVREKHRQNEIIRMIEQAERIKSLSKSFIDGVSHYLRTPMAELGSAFEVMVSNNELSDETMTKGRGLLKLLKRQTDAIFDTASSGNDARNEVDNLVSNLSPKSLLLQPIYWLPVVVAITAFAISNYAYVYILSNSLSAYNLMLRIALLVVALIALTIAYMYSQSAKGHRKRSDQLLSIERDQNNQRMSFLTTTISTLGSYGEQIYSFATSISGASYAPTFMSAADDLRQLLRRIIRAYAAMNAPFVSSTSLVSVNKIMSDSLSQLRSSLIEKGIVIDNQLTNDRDLFIGEEGLGIILMAVLRNAIQFSPQNGHISISDTKSGDILNIYIEDEGGGVEDKLIPELFKPFVRLDDIYTINRPGVGLDLFTASQIAEKYAGSITACNTEKGLKVKISLKGKLNI